MEISYLSKGIILCYCPDMDKTRINLEALMKERGDDCAALSRLLGRNAAYVQQFLKRGTPRKLDEDDRRTLAQYFGVDEIELGGPDPKAPPPAPVALIRRLQLGASAGPGSLASGEEDAGQFGFDPRWLRKIGGKPADLSIIQVTGNSMEPTLFDGDDIMVDSGDAADRLRDGIYVIRRDDELMVKRLALAGSDDGFSVISDNPAHPAWTPKRSEQVAIVGRVVWAGRRVK
jgi:phage repressor protein C with HTH and peptisase S24 domain